MNEDYKSDLMELNTKILSDLIISKLKAEIMKFFDEIPIYLSFVTEMIQ